MIKLCKTCHEEKNSYTINPPFPLCLYGYQTCWKDECMECPSTNCEHYKEGKDYSFSNIDMTEEDYEIIMRTSNDRDFIDAMIALKQKDPIEYGIKMSQIRPQAEETIRRLEKELDERLERERQQEEEDNKPKCPICDSTSITTGARGVNFMWGLIGASKTVNRCASCGHTWKP